MLQKAQFHVPLADAGVRGQAPSVQEQATQNRPRPRRPPRPLRTHRAGGVSTPTAAWHSGRRAGVLWALAVSLRQVPHVVAAAAALTRTDAQGTVRGPGRALRRRRPNVKPPPPGRRTVGCHTRPLPHGTNCHGSPGQASRCQTHARAAPRRGGFDTNGISIGNGKAARARLCGNGNETKPRFLYRRRFQTSDAEPRRDPRPETQDGLRAPRCPCTEPILVTRAAACPAPVTCAPVKWPKRGLCIVLRPPPPAPSVNV